MAVGEELPERGARLRTDLAQSARIYDYLLGGKDSFPADRAAAQAVLRAFPDGVIAARQSRAFLARAIRYLAEESGIRQFLEIGTGIPTSPNLHEVAQRAVPDVRVLYVDNDPVVVAHARALLTSTGRGRTEFLEADAREPERILSSPELRGTLDLTRPVALSMVALCHFLPDEDDPYGVVKRLMGALAPGSYLVLSQATPDFCAEPMDRAVQAYREWGIVFAPRTKAEVTRFFDGLELVEPGVRALHRWRSDGAVPEGLTDAMVGGYAAIGRKPIARCGSGGR